MINAPISSVSPPTRSKPRSLSPGRTVMNLPKVEYAPVAARITRRLKNSVPASKGLLNRIVAHAWVTVIVLPLGTVNTGIQVLSAGTDCSYWKPPLLSKVKPGAACIVGEAAPAGAELAKKLSEARIAHEATKARRKFFMVLSLRRDGGMPFEAIPTLYDEGELRASGCSVF